MPRVTIELDQATYERLIVAAVDDLRPIAWEAEHLLRRTLQRRWRSSVPESNRDQRPAKREGR